MSAHTGDFTFRVAQRIAGQDGPWSDFRTVTLEAWDQFGAADWQVEDQGAASGGTARIRIFAVPPGTTDIEARIGAGSWTSLSLARPGVALLTGFTDDVEASVTLRAVIGGGRVASAAKIVTTTTPAVATASSVTYFAGTPGEITFTFSAARPVRQFWDGSWAVQGPVTITAVSPASAETGQDETGEGGGGELTGGTRAIHGMELNPGSTDGNVTQGFDDRRRSTDGANFTYASGKNVDPGVTASSLVVAAGNVVVKARSATTLETSARRKIENFAILHVMTTLPPPNSFRPPVRAADRSARWKPSDLRLGIITPRAKPFGTPSYATALARMSGGPDVCWHSSLDAGRQISSRQRTGSYAPDIADDWHTVALVALTDNVTDAERRTLLSHLVQSGIDHWGLMSLGGGWVHRGALAGARKAPNVYAAILLQDVDLETEASFPDQTPVGLGYPEDFAIFEVSANDVGRALLAETNAGRPPRQRYQTGHVGFPEWGEQHTDSPNRDSADILAFYRFLSSPPITESALCCHLLPGGRALWGNEVVFDYMDRYYRWALDGFMDARNTADKHFPLSLAMYEDFRGPEVWVGASPEEMEPPSVTVSGTQITATWADANPVMRRNGRAALFRQDLRYSFDGGFTWTMVQGVTSPHVFDPGLGGGVRVQIRAVTDLPGPWSTNDEIDVGGAQRAIATTTGGSTPAALVPSAITSVLSSGQSARWYAPPGTIDEDAQFGTDGGNVARWSALVSTHGETLPTLGAPLEKVVEGDLPLPSLVDGVLVFPATSALSRLEERSQVGTVIAIVDLPADSPASAVVYGFGAADNGVNTTRRGGLSLEETGTAGRFIAKHTGRYGTTTDEPTDTTATADEPATSLAIASVVSAAERRAKLGASASVATVATVTPTTFSTVVSVGGRDIGGSMGGAAGCRVRHIVDFPGVVLTDAEIEAVVAALA